MHEKADLTNDSPVSKLRLDAAPKSLRDSLLAEARKLDSITKSDLSQGSCDCGYNIDTINCFIRKSTKHSGDVTKNIMGDPPETDPS